MKRIQFIHRNCRSSMYPRTNVQRAQVPDHLVKWSEIFVGYQPIFYEVDSLKHAAWADPAIGDLLILYLGSICVNWCGWTYRYLIVSLSIG